MSNIQSEIPDIKHFEDALEKTGWGIYYKFLLGFVAISSLFNAIAFSSISFALPLCMTIWSKNNIIIMYTCFILGRGIGGLILCGISDNCGKSCMIPKTFLIIFASCFIAAFSHTPPTLYIAAFFLGAGIESNIVTTKIHLAEILPIEKRGFYLVLPDLLWTTGYFLTAVLSYLISSMSSSAAIDHKNLGMKLTNWRVAFVISGGFNIIMACASALVEISPRYLLLKKRNDMAVAVLKQFYAINKSKYSETFEVRAYNLNNLIKDYEMNFDSAPVTCLQQIKTLFKRTLKMIRLLSGKKFVSPLITLIIIKLPLCLGIIGLNHILSKPFYLDLKHNCMIFSTDFIHLNMSEDKNCTFSKSFDLYKNFFLLALNIFLGQIISMCVIDRVGRKIPIFIGLLVCGIASFSLAFFEDFIPKFIISCIFLTAYSIISSTIAVLTIESFPTSVRGIAFMKTNLFSFIALSMLFNFVDLLCQDIFVIIGACMMVACMVSCCIPDFKNRPMVE